MRCHYLLDHGNSNVSLPERGRGYVQALRTSNPGNFAFLLTLDCLLVRLNATRCLLPFFRFRPVVWGATFGK